MQVTKITSPAEVPVPATHQLTEKQLYDEINYHRAEKLTKKISRIACYHLQTATAAPDRALRWLFAAAVRGHALPVSSAQARSSRKMAV